MVSLHRLLAEIRERGGAHAFEIAAERRQRDVAVEHARLADRALDLLRRAQSGGASPRASARPAARSAARPASTASSRRRRHGRARAIARRREASARQSTPWCVVEAPVLVGDQHREIARIDVMRRRRQPPAPVGQGERTQQPPVAVDDQRRALARGGEVERAEDRRSGPGEAGGEGGDDEERAATKASERPRADRAPSSAPPALVIPRAGREARRLSRR